MNAGMIYAKSYGRVEESMMTHQEIVRWSRIVSLGPGHTTDEEWSWAQEHALDFNNRKGLSAALDAERKLLVAKFLEDDGIGINKDAPLSELHVALFLGAEKSATP
jgi:hypothetical protein